MKKMIFAAAAALMMLAGVDAFAQFSVSAGYANSKLKYKTGTNSTLKTSVGYNGVFFGADYNFPINENWGIAPGIEWMFVMDKDADLGSVKSGEWKNAIQKNSRETYFNIPIDVTYGLQFESIRVFAFAGPTLSFNLTSKTKMSYDEGGSDTKNTSDWYSYSAFDLMFGVGVGVDFFEKIRIKFGYDAGMINRGDSDYKIHRQQIKLGVSYLF